MNSLVGGLTFLIIYILVALFVFLLIRQLILWYFRLNQIADDIGYIAYHYRQLDSQAASKNVAPVMGGDNTLNPPRSKRYSGIGNLPAPMSDRPRDI